jgi:conjugal transfer/entry exclusion protein
VSDPVAAGLIYLNGESVEDQTWTIYMQIMAFQNSLDATDDLPFRDITTIINDLESFMYTAGGLGYHLSNLQAQFQAIYDGGQVYIEDLQLALDKDLEQVDAALATVEGTMLTMQGHLDQIDASVTDLLDYEARLEDAGITPTEIEQVAASVRAYGAQEVQLLRQALMAQVNQESVIIAHELSGQAEVIRTTIEDAERAALRVTDTPVPLPPVRWR